MLNRTLTRAPSLTSHVRICQKEILPVAVARRRSLTNAADLKFGQPLHETHPHLLERRELTAGISAQEYADRRDRLAQLLPANSIAVLAAADLKYQTKSVFSEYHPDPDFFYLTGFKEPEALAIIEKPGDACDSEHTFHLFVRPKDETAELWEGFRSGMQAAQDVFNADKAGDINQVQRALPRLIERAENVFVHVPSSNFPTSPLSRFLCEADPLARESIPSFFGKQNAKSLRYLMNQLRVVKSKAEVRLMRKAGQSSGNAFTDLMKVMPLSEPEVAMFLENRFRKRGCDRSGYVPVVASGENALCIHYVRNDDLLRRGQLLLVDAAGEYGGYKSDITRTWPVDDTFTDAQRDLYEVVLDVQRTCVSLCRSDAKISLDRLHSIAEEKLSDGLAQLGFDINAKSMHLLCPHHVGHHVGLDVHDVPGYPRTTTLQSGNCVTVEPGVYVPNDDRWPSQFRGIGIRIEDSVCVDNEHPLVLTTEAVKERVDIEALRRQATVEN